jgi:hypothetical protein
MLRRLRTQQYLESGRHSKYAYNQQTGVNQPLYARLSDKLEDGPSLEQGARLRKTCFDKKHSEQVTHLKVHFPYLRQFPLGKGMNR